MEQQRPTHSPTPPPAAAAGAYRQNGYEAPYMNPQGSTSQASLRPAYESGLTAPYDQMQFPMPRQQPQQQPQQPAYDRPLYEYSYEQGYENNNNNNLAAPDDRHRARAKRRESAMFMMNNMSSNGQSQGPRSQLREEMRM